MAETQRHEAPKANKGEEARAARGRLARALLLSLGATEDIAAGGGVDAADDPHFMDDIVTSLVDDGVVALARLPDRRATEADLDRGLLGPAFVSALDRRRGQPAGPRERARLARLYAIASDPEKAASCYREVLDEKGSLPLGLVLEIAELAANAKERGLALGAVDRVAEVVLTGDAAKDGRLEDVALAGGALERARDVALAMDAAPRAVALARAAVLLYERSGLKREAARSLDGLGRAQLAAGERPSARATFERRRALAVAQSEPIHAAHSLTTQAEAFLATGDAEGAVDRLEQASDAFAASGDRKASSATAIRAAELRIKRGDLGAAAGTLERARAHAAAAGDATLESRARHELARARLGEGQLGLALVEAEAAATDREAVKDMTAAADARVLRAQALLLSGDGAGARAELLKARDHASAGAAGRALEVWAELELLAPEGTRALEMVHSLLAFASRLHGASDSPVEALRATIRRGEVAFASGDLAQARAMLAVASLSEAPELVSRIALLEASLATEDGDRRAALDRAFDLAFATDHHGPRVAAGLARAKARLAAGKPGPAAGDVRAALEAVRDTRKSLREEDRARYLDTPIAREALEAGKTFREALARSVETEGKKAMDDETGGVETVLNALDVLLGSLGPGK